MKQFLSSRLFRLIASTGIALLLYFICPPCFSSAWLALVLFILLVLVNLDQFFGRFSWLTNTARVLVGCLFIFSGFIKANDPVGFGYKMQEYFTVFGEGFSCDMKLPAVKADGVPCVKEQSGEAAEKAAPKKTSFMKPVWDFFGDYSLLIAILICGVEMVLGFFLLLGFRTKLTLWLLLGMIVFFSFLTFYSACCNKVKSCGCFGDFLPLTPWESFWKDLILLVLVTLLFTGTDNIRPLFNRNGLMWISVIVLTFISFWIPYYTWKHLPFFDFRPFAVGTNLYTESREKNPANKECLPDSILFTYYYKKGNQYKQFGQYLIAGTYTKAIDTTSADSTWEFFCSNREVLHEGNCAASILNFNISDLSKGAEITDSLIKLKGGNFFFVMYDAEKTDKSVMAGVNAFYEQCRKNNIPFNALSHSDSTQLATFRKSTGAAFPVYFCDDIPLKTFIRSNPGLVYVENSVVKAMWHFNDFPTFTDFRNEYPGKK